MRKVLAFGDEILPSTFENFDAWMCVSSNVPSPQTLHAVSIPKIINSP